MLSLQEISDRLEIQQLMTDYSTAIDRKRFDDLDVIFTPDAFIDYTALGGISGRYPEVREWLKGVMVQFPHSLHMITNMSIKVDGDKATGRTICLNPQDIQKPDGSFHVMFFGLWYVDKFVRTADGWRICERVEEKCLQHNVPEMVYAGE